MFKNYFKIAFRHFLKQKGYAIINILGLTIGLACCLLIVLFVMDELSYDDFHEKADRIYRVAVKSQFGDQELDEAQTSELMAGTLVREYPEVVAATRIQHTPNMLVRYQDKVFNETQFLWVDSTFFDVFTAKMLYGDPETTLEDHHTVVMTRSTASKFFDDLSQAVGKIVQYEDGTPYRVSGIVEDPPVNSHFHYGMLCPLSSWEWRYPGFWLNHYMYTYIVLQKDVSPQQLEAQFPNLIKQFVARDIQRRTNMNLEDFYKSGGYIDYHLQPLKSIHLHSNLLRELEPNSDIKYVYIFSAVAFIILIIACINFTNLATARSLGRSREVGMRKVLGSIKRQLIVQFILESVFMAIIALGCAFVLADLLLPYFNTISGKQLSLIAYANGYAIPALLGLGILTGILAGIYPAFFLASYKPAAILKSTSTPGTGKSGIRNMLVVFQFSVSIVLLIATLIVYNQLQFIQNKRLGFNKENIVVIKRGWAIGQNPDGSAQANIGSQSVFDVFRNELLRNPNILSVAGVRGLPGMDVEDFIARSENAPSDQRLQFHLMEGDYDFIETMKFELVEGRNFSPQILSDTLAVVINESAGKLLGYEKPYIGKRIGFPGSSDFFVHIIGVVKDFHYQSLHHKIEPLVIVQRNDSRTYIAVRIQPSDVSTTLAFLKNTWNRYLPYKPFEYYFFDQDYDNLYRAEQKISNIFTNFTGLALFIACLGLLGLASFATESRTKEIGIRKVLGASVSNIIIIMSREFVKWVLIANVIAWPIAWFVTNQWLQNFAYRIHMGVWTFVFASTVAIIIAVVTVSSQAIKAAISDPVKTLRYE